MNQIINKYGMKIITNRSYAAGVALVFAFLSFFDIPVGWMSTIIIGLITLQQGMRSGAYIIAWAILPAVAMLYLGQTFIFVNVLILHYLLIWIFSGIFRRTQDWGFILQIAASLGILAVCGVHLYNPDIQQWWLIQFNAFLKEIAANNSFGINIKFLQAYADYITTMATGVMTLMVLISNLMNLLLARWWQLSLKGSKSLKQECYQVRVHFVTVIGLILIFAGLLIDSKLFIDLLPLALMPFIISGWSFFHAYLAGKKRATVWLIIFYSLFILLSPYVLTFLSVLGVVDSLVNMRKRWRSIALTE